MTSVGTAFENFIFRSFNVFGRASRSEYWIVIPLIWIAILGFFVLDVMTFWGHLRAREVPSLNPLSYGSFLLWSITLISRTTLGIRRIQDGGASGKLAFLPISATILGFWLVLGLATAALTAAGGEGAAMTALSFLGLFALIKTGLIWEALFTLANEVHPAEILTFFGELYGAVPKPSLAAGVENYGALYASAPEVATPMLVMTMILTFGPFVLMAIWLFLLLKPSQIGFNGYGDAPSAGGMSSSGRSAGGAKGKAKHNPYAGYALLSEQYRERMKASPEARQAEVHALYKERVLKGNQ